MKKKFVILGNFLGKNIVGLTRMGYEYLMQIDNFADEYDIVLLLPIGYSQYASGIRNMKIVEEGMASSKWTTTVATRYAKANNRTIVNLTFPFSLKKNSIVEIADVRYFEKINGKYFDSFKFRVLMKIKAVVGSYNAKVVATISEFSKQRINKFLHVPLNKITVIPCGWEHIDRINPDNTVFERYNQLHRKEYYFTLGSLARHKNHKLITQLSEKDPTSIFVIGGGVDPQIFYKDCPTEGNKNVIFTGMLTDGEVKALMMNCKAFVFPSLYEGFGIPPLEALACGAEVIVSDIPVMHELFKDTVYYINPYKCEVPLSDIIECSRPMRREKVLSECSWRIAGEKWREVFEQYEEMEG